MHRSFHLRLSGTTACAVGTTAVACGTLAGARLAAGADITLAFGGIMLIALGAILIHHGRDR